VDVAQYVQLRSSELKAFEGACREDGQGKQDYVGVVSCTSPVIGLLDSASGFPIDLPGRW